MAPVKKCRAPLCVPLFTCFLFSLVLSACSREEPAPPQEPAQPAPATAHTSSADPAEVGVEAIDESDYRRHLETLASDAFGGRAPGSPGEELTVAYLVSHFENLGLEPANGDRYTQDVPLAWVRLTNAPDLVISGGEGADLALTYPTEQVMWTRRQVPETSLADSEMVFVGYGINAPERGWNDYAGVDVQGKTVVMLVNDPGYATQDPELFNGNAMTYYGRWDYKLGEAARQGATGAIIVHDRLPAAYGWSTVTNSWTGKQFDMVLPDQGASLASMEAWITRESAAALFAKAGLDIEEMYRAAQTPGFEAVPMPLRASAKLVNEVQSLDSKNVAAILRGSESAGRDFHLHGALGPLRH